jgi:chromosome segregation ATPase
VSELTRSRAFLKSPCREKEREHAELENNYNSANKALQQAETTLSNLRSQLKAKQDELAGEPYYLATWTYS